MTKIPSVEEVAKELLVRASYVTSESVFEGAERFAYQQGFQDALAMVYIELTGTHKSKGTLTADRTALLTELKEWVEVKKIDTFLMNVANRKRAGHINRTLVEIQAHINNLINPTNT